MLRHIKTPEPEEIRVIGGLTRNALYMEIKAAMAGRSITVVELADSVALGAALLGGIGAGIYADRAAAVAGASSIERRLAPDPAVLELYDRLLNRVYRQGYSTLRPLNEAAQQVTSIPPR